MLQKIIDTYHVKERDESLELFYRPLWIGTKEGDDKLLDIHILDVAFESKECEFKNRDMLQTVIKDLKSKLHIITWQDESGKLKLYHHPAMGED